MRSVGRPGEPVAAGPDAAPFGRRGHLPAAANTGF